MTVGSLFAGIGGFDLGFERAGFEIKWQVEIDDYARRVLRNHWPKPTLYRDIRAIEWASVASVDVICGGFPCQDVSYAGPGAGLDGERSGLWAEMERAVRGVRPGYVVVENSAALLGRGLGRVLGDLAALGYDAEWHCIPASYIGAPHERDRIWIVADAEGVRRGARRPWRLTDCLAGLSDAPRWNPADTAGEPAIGPAISWRERAAWPDEPALLGVDDGVPNRMDRVRVIGNAIVPQIAEWIARRILEAEGLAA